MNATIAAPITAAILISTVAVSFAVAFGLEWLCLRGAMVLTPARQSPARPGAPGIRAQTRLTRNVPMAGNTEA